MGLHARTKEVLAGANNHRNGLAGKSNYTRTRIGGRSVHLYAFLNGSMHLAVVVGGDTIVNRLQWPANAPYRILIRVDGAWVFGRSHGYLGAPQTSYG